MSGFKNISLKKIKLDLDQLLSTGHVRLTDLQNLLNKINTFLENNADVEARHVETFAQCIIQYINCVSFYAESHTDQHLLRNFSQIITKIPGLLGMQKKYLEEISVFILEKVTDSSLPLWFTQDLLMNFNVSLLYFNNEFLYKTIPDKVLFVVCQLIDMLSVCGDYNYQVKIIETIFSIYSPQKIAELAGCFFPECQSLQKSLCNINKQTLVSDVRQFLNAINKSNLLIFSLKPDLTFLDDTCLDHTQQKPVNEVWVDFNVGSNTISILCNEKCVEHQLNNGGSCEDGVAIIIINTADVDAVKTSRWFQLEFPRSVGSIIHFILKKSCAVRFLTYEQTIKVSSLILYVPHSTALQELEKCILPSLFQDRLKIFSSAIHQDSQSEEMRVTAGDLHVNSTQHQENTSNDVDANKALGLANRTFYISDEETLNKQEIETSDIANEAFDSSSVVLVDDDQSMASTHLSGCVLDSIDLTEDDNEAVHSSGNKISNLTDAFYSISANSRNNGEVEMYYSASPTDDLMNKLGSTRIPSPVLDSINLTLDINDNEFAQPSGEKCTDAFYTANSRNNGENQMYYSAQTNGVPVDSENKVGDSRNKVLTSGEDTCSAPNLKSNKTVGTTRSNIRKLISGLETQIVTSPNAQKIIHGFSPKINARMLHVPAAKDNNRPETTSKRTNIATESAIHKTTSFYFATEPENNSGTVLKPVTQKLVVGVDHPKVASELTNSATVNVIHKTAYFGTDPENNAETVSKSVNVPAQKLVANDDSVDHPKVTSGITNSATGNVIHRTAFGTDPENNAETVSKSVNVPAQKLVANDDSVDHPKVTSGITNSATGNVIHRTAFGTDRKNNAETVLKWVNVPAQKLVAKDDGVGHPKVTSGSTNSATGNVIYKSAYFGADPENNAETVLKSNVNVSAQKSVTNSNIGQSKITPGTVHKTTGFYFAAEPENNAEIVLKSMVNVPARKSVGIGQSGRTNMITRSTVRKTSSYSAAEPASNGRTALKSINDVIPTTVESMFQTESIAACRTETSAIQKITSPYFATRPENNAGTCLKSINDAIGETVENLLHENKKRFITASPFPVASMPCQPVAKPGKSNAKLKRNLDVVDFKLKLKERSRHLNKSRTFVGDAIDNDKVQQNTNMQVGLKRKSDHNIEIKRTQSKSEHLSSPSRNENGLISLTKTKSEVTIYNLQLNTENKNISPKNHNVSQESTLKDALVEQQPAYTSLDQVNAATFESFHQTTINYNLQAYSDQETLIMDADINETIEEIPRTENINTKATEKSEQPTVEVICAELPHTENINTKEAEKSEKPAVEVICAKLPHTENIDTKEAEKSEKPTGEVICAELPYTDNTNTKETEKTEKPTVICASEQVTSHRVLENYNQTQEIQSHNNERALRFKAANLEAKKMPVSIEKSVYIEGSPNQVYEDKTPHVQGSTKPADANGHSEEVSPVNSREAIQPATITQTHMQSFRSCRQEDSSVENNSSEVKLPQPKEDLKIHRVEQLKQHLLNNKLGTAYIQLKRLDVNNRIVANYIKKEIATNNKNNLPVVIIEKSTTSKPPTCLVLHNNIESINLTPALPNREPKENPTEMMEDDTEVYVINCDNEDQAVPSVSSAQLLPLDDVHFIHHGNDRSTPTEVATQLGGTEQKENLDEETSAAKKRKLNNSKSSNFKANKGTIKSRKKKLRKLYNPDEMLTLSQLGLTEEDLNDNVSLSAKGNTTFPHTAKLTPLINSNDMDTFRWKRKKNISSDESLFTANNTNRSRASKNQNYLNNKKGKIGSNKPKQRTIRKSLTILPAWERSMGKSAYISSFLDNIIQSGKKTRKKNSGSNVNARSSRFHHDVTIRKAKNVTSLLNEKYVLKNRKNIARITKLGISEPEPNPQEIQHNHILNQHAVQVEPEVLQDVTNEAVKPKITIISNLLIKPGAGNNNSQASTIVDEQLNGNYENREKNRLEVLENLKLATEFKNPQKSNENSEKVKRDIDEFLLVNKNLFESFLRFFRGPLPTELLAIHELCEGITDSLTKYFEEKTNAAKI